MRRQIPRYLVGTLLIALSLLPSQLAVGQPPTLPLACQDLAFSTEEDFIAGSESPSGYISDGDLLSFRTDPDGNVTPVLCARNHELLAPFGIQAGIDLGLDAADVLDVETSLIAFSTSLNSPPGAQVAFKQGDLLVTNGAIILNTALTSGWSVGYDVGLDAVHFFGDIQDILGFLKAAAEMGTVDAAGIAELFAAFPVDVWFSTEGTYTPPTGALGFLDGDLLSARNGTVVLNQADLPDAVVPAGIPQDGVDFGLDAVTSDRRGLKQEIRFSTEILYDDKMAFADGDILRAGNGVEWHNADLLASFKPQASELGLDALHLGLAVEPGQVEGVKFYDVEGDGVRDPGDDPLDQWEIRLDGVDDLGFPIALQTQTTAQGVYSFTVASGVYSVTEVCPVGAAWVQSLPKPEDGVCGHGVHVVTVTSSGVYKDLDFGNYQVQGQQLYLPIILRAVQP